MNEDWAGTQVHSRRTPAYGMSGRVTHIEGLEDQKEVRALVRILLIGLEF